MARPTKEDVIAKLEENGIEYPEDAKYDELTALLPSEETAEEAAPSEIFTGKYTDVIEDSFKDEEGNPKASRKYYNGDELVHEEIVNE